MGRERRFDFVVAARILRELDDGGRNPPIRLSQSRIARAANMNWGGCQVYLDVFEQRGYVKMMEEGSSITVQITTEGREYLPRLLGVIAAMTGDATPFLGLKRRKSD